MNILGINAYHANSAACLLRDGKLVAAVEEERFRRIKHWAGFPEMAIAYCLAEAKLSLRDIDVVAVNRNNRANLARKIAYAVGHRPSMRLMLDRMRHRKTNTGVRQDLFETWPKEQYRGTIEYVEHHLAHLSSTFYLSPFSEAVAVSVDGFGDFASAAWGWGNGAALSLDGRVLFPHSLGIFYQAMTQYLGFPNYGDEYKLMGLAAYGRSDLVKSVRSIVDRQADGGFKLNLRFFRHHRETIALEWNGGAPACGELFSNELEAELGPRRNADDPITSRHQNLAFATQRVFEEALFNLLHHLNNKYGSEALTLSGGCAYNSVANGKILPQTKFRNIYLQSAAGDAGGAIGAALAIWHRRCKARTPAMTHAYWGPGWSDDELASIIDDRWRDLAQDGYDKCHLDHDQALVEMAANAIARGLIVGWFQGRMEWGPRALGNRSILGDPRRSDMKEILNLKIKRRESFRPFAPSILREAMSDWFEIDDDVPFMLQVYSIRPSRRKQIPAVTHVDGTGRLQTVTRDANPRYYDLISAFQRLTNVPMVLNTSFNENEPIVCTPQEALDCFLRTKMDFLVLGRSVLTRNQSQDA